MRLNKFLADCGVCSRREADRLIEAGEVRVDGQIAGVGQQVAEGQTVTVNGRPVTPEEERVLLALYKPVGVVCTTDKTWGDTTVDDIVRYPKRVFYAGRLDKDSEGLLLLTNDGALQDRMMRAANYHEKEYEVFVDRPLDDRFLKKMARGVYLRELGVTTRACRTERISGRKFRIILTQGMNRQIRRMCMALGYRALAIKRVRIMNILLGDLKPGQYREVTPEEREELYRRLEKEEQERSGEKHGNGETENRRTEAETELSQ